MDQWTEVLPEGSNVWIVPREMYTSVCLAVANRSTVAKVITVDCSASTNVTLLAADEDRASSSTHNNKSAALALKRIVGPGVTQVVGVLSPSDDSEPTSISYAANVSASELVANSLGGVHESRADVHSLLLEAEKQSEDVAAFLGRAREQS